MGSGAAEVYLPQKLFLVRILARPSALLCGHRPWVLVLFGFLRAWRETAVGRWSMEPTSHTSSVSVFSSSFLAGKNRYPV